MTFIGWLVAVKVFAAGSKSSALASVTVPLALPPVIKTLPLASKVAVCSARGLVIAFGSKVNVLVAGSKISALDRFAVSLNPPVIKTVPFGRSVMVKSTRAAFMLLMVVKVRADGL